MSFSAQYRRDYRHGIPEGRSRNSHYHTCRTSIYLLSFPTTRRSQVYLSHNLLAAKFIIGIHLFLVLVLEVQETLQLLLTKDLFDDVDGDVLRTVVFWAFDDVVAAVLVFPYVAFQTIQAESVTADLFAVASADIVTDIA